MAAGVITTGSFAKALWPGVNKWFQQDYAEWTEEFSQIFAQNASEKAFEEDVGVSGFGLAPVKAQGATIEYDDAEQNFIARYNHYTYGKGFVITREMYEDDLYGVIGARGSRSLSRASRITKEVVHANILNRAFNSSYTMGTQSDAKELCATDHPFGPYGGTFQNELTIAADLSEASLEDLIVLIGSAQDARGLQMMLQAKRLVVPVQEQFNAMRILETELRSGSADNDVNAIRQGKFIANGSLVNHYLTDPDAWFIVTDCMDGLKTFNRRGLEFAMDNDFDTENAKYKVTERYSAGWSDPRGIYGSPGS